MVVFPRKYARQTSVSVITYLSIFQRTQNHCCIPYKCTHARSHSVNTFISIASTEVTMMLNCITSVQITALMPPCKKNYMALYIYIYLYIWEANLENLCFLLDFEFGVWKFSLKNSYLLHKFQTKSRLINLSHLKQEVIRVPRHTNILFDGIIKDSFFLISQNRDQTNMTV